MFHINSSNNESDRRRVVITGIGVVSSIGIGKIAFWEGLKLGRSGIKRVTLFDTSSVNSKLAGEISDFDPTAILGAKGLRHLDRTTLIALAAAKLALEDANFIINTENQNKTGLVLGSTMGSIWSINEFDKLGLKNGPNGINPALFPNTVMNSPASQISIKFGIKGFNATIATGFTSSLEALEYGRKFISLGRADAVLVGGVEELCEQTYKGWYKIGFLSGSKSDNEEICAPFDKRHNGVILGEGATIFVLENFQLAINRRAKIYAMLTRLGNSYDRKSIYGYNMKAEGAKLAVAKAIKSSGLKARDIDYVAAGANSSKEGDIAEARALENFSNKNNKVSASACKSMLGESFSAGGAFQVATGLMAINEEMLPPTINFQTQDRRCSNIDCVANVARKKKVRHVLVLSASPMGQNAAVILSKVQQ